MILFLILLVACTGLMVWLRMTAKNGLLLFIGVFFVALVTGVGSGLLAFLVLLVLVPLTTMLYFAPGLRRKWLTTPLYHRVKESMPPISKTEQEAIDAGTVWWDAELFSGNPDWGVLWNTPKPELTEEEQAFIDGPVEEVCEMADDWQITHELNDLPEEIWAYLKREKFFGLNAAKAFGGLEFSAYAQSCIVQKLSTRSGTLAVTVMVPNSLGPAELLYHYGTQEQKDYYLPRLVNGEEVPCFGLTNPWAGSDAGGMPDSGIVCRQQFEGEETLGFRINWEKRYITLGPVATLLGLAFKAYDPDGLLGEEYELGVTCALIPTDTPGVEIGNRHLPLNASFHNGPNRGTDVFVPMKWIIGGQERVGQGWKMLMESLAAGRGISLPAAGAGGAKVATRASGAYARIREQFGLEIGKFEGIEEVLARIGGLTYLLDSGRVLMTSALAIGEKPAVMSAIVKQQCTDLSRIVINDAMDLHGGKAICMGPGNYLARAYQQIPIGITVEGANILTRSMIIFGQGAMRCHPYLLSEVKAVTAEDQEAGKEQFDLNMRDHIAHVISNKSRAFALGLSRGYLANVNEHVIENGEIRRYIQQMEHLSSAFAFLADVTLLILGGSLKRKEMISGRFADALSFLFLASAAIKRFKDNGQDPDELPLVSWACEYSLYQVQQALHGVLLNYPVSWMGSLLRITVFPSGRYLKLPSDVLSQKVAVSLQTPGEVRDRLTEHLYIASDTDAEISAQLEAALGLAIRAKDLRKELKQKGFELEADIDHEQWLQKLVDENEISESDADMLRQTREMVHRVISVDDFPQKAKAGN